VFHRLLLSSLLAAALLGLASCSSSGDDASIESTTTSSSSTTTSTTTTTEPGPSTVLTVPAPHLTSPGAIDIGGTSYDFVFECYAAGAGDVLALGVGTDPVTGESTEAVVQAFLGLPYVAIVVDGGAVFELAVDRQAELFIQQGVIHGSALRFVAAQSEAGVGTELGLGSVSVECDDFATGLPDGYPISDESEST
jgi:hypothetical protein